MIMILALTALLGQQPAESAVELDFEFFRTEVQPIFLERKAGFTRCVVCHSEGGNVGFLEELASGATEWDEEQSRANFESLSRLVVPGDPQASRLLMHPLEPDAGRRRVPQRRAAVQLAGRPVVPDPRGLGARRDGWAVDRANAVTRQELEGWRRHTGQSVI